MTDQPLLVPPATYTTEIDSPGIRYFQRFGPIFSTVQLEMDVIGLRWQVRVLFRHPN